jgi:hypothetical protein
MIGDIINDSLPLLASPCEYSTTKFVVEVAPIGGIMSYYIDYKKRYLWLDRIIHFVAALVFAGLMAAVTYMIEVYALLWVAPAQSAQLWMEQGIRWMISPPMLVLPALVAAVALVFPKVFRKLDARSVTSTTAATSGLLDGHRLR